MQGVRLVSTPPTNTSGIATAGLPDNVSRSVVKSTIVRGVTSVTWRSLTSDGELTECAQIRHSSVAVEAGLVYRDSSNPEKGMSRFRSRTWLVSSFAMLAAAIWFPCVAWGQGHDHDKTTAKAGMGDDDHMVGMADHAMMDMGHDSIMGLPRQMPPLPPPTHDDSTRALAIVAELRHAIAKYK